MDEKVFKNKITINNDFSNSGIDISHINATFSYNANGTVLHQDGEHPKCITTTEWAQDLPIIIWSYRINQPCMTNTSLIATFNYDLFVHDDGTFEM